MAVQTITTTRESLHLRLQRNPYENEVRPLIEEMLASGLFPEEEILEWEVEFFNDRPSMPLEDQLVFLLTEWILPSGDEDFEKTVRSILRMPEEKINTLIEQHQKAAIEKLIEEKKRARTIAVGQDILQYRADMAQHLNQSLSGHYEEGRREVLGLADRMQRQSDRSTEQLSSLNNRISRSRETFTAYANETAKLLERRKELQNERRAMLNNAMKGLQL